MWYLYFYLSIGSASYFLANFCTLGTLPVGNKCPNKHTDQYKWSKLKIPFNFCAKNNSNSGYFSLCCFCFDDSLQHLSLLSPLKCNAKSPRSLFSLNPLTHHETVALWGSLIPGHRPTLPSWKSSPGHPAAKVKPSWITTVSHRDGNTAPLAGPGLDD